MTPSIEAKRPSGDTAQREIDPYAPSVIRQAFNYAAELGAPYFATYNGDRFVLFRTFEEGRQLLQRSTKSYVVTGVEKFADTILDEIARLEADENKWDSLDDAFIQRIRSLHELITPELEAALADRLSDDESFRASFVSWANAQGLEYDDGDSEDREMIRENFAEQAAYLLVNKIVFYKILENSDAYGDDIRPLAVSIHRVRADLEEHFEDVVDEIASLVEEDTEPNQMIRTENYRLVTRTQHALRDEQKWSVFFNAPAVYFDIVGQEDIVSLSEVAEVTRGFTSGANDFYYGRMEEWEELGLEQYTEPLLKATGQVDRILFNDDVADEWSYLEIHDLVKEALNDDDEYLDVSEADRVKEWLATNGHTDLAEYIEWGEDQGYHDRPTTSARDIWFDLGGAETAPIIMTDFTWREHRVVWNNVGALGSTQFYYVVPDDDVDPKVLCGILNSRLVWLMSELKRRWAEGQGMARSRLKVYETEQLPIPDPRGLTVEERERIVDCFEALMDREVELGEDASVEATESERDSLDSAVLEPLGMSERLDEIKEGVERMVAMREQAAGEDTNVLIERPEETEVIELEGVSEARESTTLGDFQ
ncbi:hypothetical protein [Haloplanus salilacus]|uniref:hypothetical protein n=1 Tax=Haloplanus salilacus TaxID=2949994 RepID=UPI0030D2B3B9